MIFSQFIFKLKWYSCIFISNGKKGFEELIKAIPNVVFLDVILPDMNGYDLVKQIRTNKCFKDLAIIFLTIILRVNVNIKVEELGAIGFISKSFNLKELDN